MDTHTQNNTYVCTYACVFSMYAHRKIMFLFQVTLLTASCTVGLQHTYPSTISWPQGGF